MISQDEIAHLEALAQLLLTAEEKKRFAKELSDILDFFEKLQEVDTKNVEPTAQVTGLQNITDDDAVEPFLAAAKLVASSPHPTQENHITVDSVF